MRDFCRENLYLWKKVFLQAKIKADGLLFAFLHDAAADVGGSGAVYIRSLPSIPLNSGLKIGHKFPPHFRA